MTETTLPPEADEGVTGLDAPELVPEAAPALAPKTKAAKAAKPAAAPAAAQRRITIVLEENDNIPPTGQYIGVNGRSYLLRPGEEASVPLEVLEALNCAIEENPRTDASGNVIDYRKKMRFPYRIVG